MNTPFIKQLRVLRHHHCRGQIMPMLALFVFFFLFLILGLAVDMGLYYRERAILSRSVDGVAIRLANRVSATDDTREQIIMEFMRANVDGYEGEFEWVSDEIDGETFSVWRNSDNESFIAYNIKSTGEDDDAVSVEIRTHKYMDTFFMRLAQIDRLRVEEVSVAERFPGIVVMVLDVSGSMRGSGESSKWYAMTMAAKEFVNSEFFSDERDRFAIFIYGTRAIPIYPEPIPDNIGPNGVVEPSRPFRTDALAALDKLAVNGSAATRPEYGFNGSTSASEGMRLAFESVESFLSRGTAATVRDNYKVSYVFLTDGGFNTLRTWAVGRGYGWNPSTTAATVSFSDASTTFLERYEPSIDGTPTQASAQLGWTGTRRVPTWHGAKLINASTYGGRGWGQLTNFTRPGAGAGRTGPYNLDTLFGSRNFDAMPGVNVAIHAQTYNVPGGSASFGTWKRRHEGAFSWPRNWWNVIYEPNGQFFQLRNSANEVLNATQQDTTVAHNNVNYLRSLPDFYHETSTARIRWEMLQPRYGYLVSVPEPVWPGNNSTSNNPTTPAAKMEVTNRSGANLSNDWLSFYNTAGRVYANYYGSATKDGSNNRGIFIEQTNTAGMTNTGGAHAYNSWNRAFARLTDYYPDFYYGLYFNDLSAEDREWLEDNNHWRHNDGDNEDRPNHNNYEMNGESMVRSLGFPRYIYRPSRAEWVRNNMHPEDRDGRYLNSNSLDGTFLDEGDFLTEAQCFIARIQQRATVYTIGYQTGTGPAAVLRRMANHGNVPYPGADHREGLFQQADTGDISAVFQMIASRIAVSITK